MKLTFFEALLEGYLAATGKMNFVQIGANDGKFNDPIFPFVMRNRTATSILLIEPQSEIIPFLTENYADHPNATINYERSHLTEERRQRLEAFLIRQGYRILHWSGADTVAILQH